jgi:hypothetical protein
MVRVRPSPTPKASTLRERSREIAVTARSTVSCGLKTAPSTFDPPGSRGTNPKSIDPEGTITGYYGDVSGVIHGFLRTRDGIVETFDVPGAISTVALSINTAVRLQEAMRTQIVSIRRAFCALATAL